MPVLLKKVLMETFERQRLHSKQRVYMANHIRIGAMTFSGEFNHIHKGK